jgi:hypothetical protein
MANIFTLENFSDFSDKINIDDLYEKKRNYDLSKLVLFNKILNRVHVRIKTTSAQKLNDNFCWYVVPEVIIGVPKYDQSACIAYILDKLQENKFNTKYVHPNTIFISWAHWVPSYVRSEIKKKTGIVVNEYGEKQEDQHNKQPTLDSVVLNTKKQADTTKKQERSDKFTPITSYKPIGNLIYDTDLFPKHNNI